MLSAVDLDNQLRRASNKVADEGAYGNLAVKTRTRNFTSAEMSPQLTFGIRRIGAQFAGPDRRSTVGFVQQALPRPLPQAGGEISARSRA